MRNAIETEKLIRVIKDLSETLTPVERRLDPGEVRSALDQVLEKNGVARSDYEAALRDRPSLAELERQALSQEAIEAPDPGPYDAISRESPSGVPGDLTKSREE